MQPHLDSPIPLCLHFIPYNPPLQPEKLFRPTITQSNMLPALPASNEQLVEEETSYLNMLCV